MERQHHGNSESGMSEKRARMDRRSRNKDRMGRKRMQRLNRDDSTPHSLNFLLGFLNSLNVTWQVIAEPLTERQVAT